MNDTKTIFLTKKGMKELKKEIATLERELQQVRRDLHEIDKTDGHDERLARAEKLAQLEILEGELADKKAYQQSAQLYPRKRDALKVAIGSVVDLIDASGRMVRYTIVDSLEANPSDGRISFKSPLGQHLLGKQIKDIIEWGNGLKSTSFQLVSIG